MFGDTIYRLRKKKKLSLCELGKLLGTDSKVIYKWESHKECPSITLVPLLVQLLDDDEGDLFLYYYDFVIGG
jgi:transcriptional regulator with XRE-family HTH domain